MIQRLAVHGWDPGTRSLTNFKKNNSKSGPMELHVLWWGGGVRVEVYCCPKPGKSTAERNYRLVSKL